MPGNAGCLRPRLFCRLPVYQFQLVALRLRSVARSPGGHGRRGNRRPRAPSPTRGKIVRTSPLILCRRPALRPSRSFQPLQEGSAGYDQAPARRSAGSWPARASSYASPREMPSNSAASATVTTRQPSPIPHTSFLLVVLLYTYSLGREDGKTNEKVKTTWRRLRHPMSPRRELSSKTWAQTCTSGNASARACSQGWRGP